MSDTLRQQPEGKARFSHGIELVYEIARCLQTARLRNGSAISVQRRQPSSALGHLRVKRITVARSPRCRPSNQSFIFEITITILSLAAARHGVPRKSPICPVMGSLIELLSDGLD